MIKYTVIAGIEEDESEDIEQLRPSKDSDGFYDVDKDLNVDAFANSISGGIMPGVQLSSLCGDD